MSTRLKLPSIAALAIAALIVGIYGNTAAARDEVCVYDIKDYAGNEFCTAQSISNLADEDWNDQIASVEVRGNIEVILYANAGFTGKSIHLTGNASRLRKGMDRDASSLQIVGIESSTGGNMGNGGAVSDKYPASQGWQLQQYCNCNSGKRCYVRGNEIGECIFECPSGCRN